jgi:hypothetical protein
MNPNTRKTGSSSPRRALAQNEKSSLASSFVLAPK